RLLLPLPRRHPAPTLFPYTTLFRSRFWRRFIHRGAHQHSSPSIVMTAGTSSMRITVASRISAEIIPKAMYFIITISENPNAPVRSEEHTSELQSRFDLVCRLLLEKK